MIDPFQIRLAIRILWVTGLYSFAELSSLFSIHESSIIESLGPLLSESARKALELPSTEHDNATLKTVAQRNRRKSIAESKAAQKRAAELMGQGVSADHIAKALNVSTVTVYQYLKKHKQDLMQDSSDLPNNNEETE